MPYLFGALVVANLAMFGYFWTNPVELQIGTTSAQTAKTQLQNPMIYRNTSQYMPPLIGEK